MAGQQAKKSPRQRYGEELRLRREAAGLTQVALGELVVLSPSMIAHIEAGRRKPQLEDARRLDRVLNTGGFFERYLDSLDVVEVADHFVAALEAEQTAIAISEYAVSLVPGILQTPAYAREVYRTSQPNPIPSEIDKLVVNRVRRAEILKDPLSPTMWFVLNENVIRTEVGGPKAMAEQLQHILALAHGGRILVQVVPRSSGAHACMNSMLSLMRFDDSPDLAYVEGLYTGNLIDDPAMVQKCKDAYDLARASALSPDASQDLLGKVAEEYSHGRPAHP
ncbi:helix-turn-helix transcriptional regulator [Streptomyces sp. TS71-3]|uniref:helix-turn-helix domain-containing protein n=1 Tax=Streptomyces sp. TS71-3 TaxID=2733862 RepID=UPI001B1C2D64|nr:helix-turn-helix transcriptional regulator [Streptomyces sp. TS71-3]GHJ35139.1 transcriptional regulator [Streptomyces sp. TS71-3]